MSTSKKCFKCGATKCLSDFYKHQKMADGHVNKCKECNKKDVRKNYRDNIQYYKEYERSRHMLPHRVAARLAYRHTDAGKAAFAKASKAYNSRNPIKRGANNIVNNAIRDGKLMKSATCEQCGNTTARIHGHHDDYAFPLDVRWLCPGCHAKWHRVNGPGLNCC